LRFGWRTSAGTVRQLPRTAGKFGETRRQILFSRKYSRSDFPETLKFLFSENALLFFGNVHVPGKRYVLQRGRLPRTAIGTPASHIRDGKSFFHKESAGSHSGIGRFLCSIRPMSALRNGIHPLGHSFDEFRSRTWREPEPASSVRVPLAE